VALTTLFEVVFAVSAAVAALALGAAALRKAPAWLLAGLTAVVACAAVVAWVFFALRHGRELAAAAGGISVCALALAGAAALRRAHANAEAFDAHLAAAQARLREQVDAEARSRAAELERTLARARADSVSLL
jgi:2-keto-3-deoxy-6-phosphogluconate aldolase